MKRIIVILLLYISCFVFIKTYSERHHIVEVSSPYYCNYDQPWPGMISTNPLYILKKIRDKIIRLYLVNDTNKLDYLLFDSDKLLHEVILLDTQGQYDEAYKIGLRSQHDITLFITEYVHRLNTHETLPPWAKDRFSCITKRQQLILQELLRKRPSGQANQFYSTLMELLLQNVHGFPNFLEIYNDQI